jgi:transcriptional regulator with XRE-family HTH domain
MNSSQCRAARALINWSQGDLAKRAKVSEKAIWDFEADKRKPREQTITRLSTTLERAGVVFIAENGGGPGVRLKRKGKR